MKKFVLSGLAAGVIAMSAAAQADGWAIMGKAGTLGLGLDVVKSVNPHFNLRAGFNRFSYGEDYDETDIEYDVDIDLASLGGFLDWHPSARGRFRITAGILYNGNEADLEGKATGDFFTFNGTSYPAAAVGNVTGTGDPERKAAPYLGIGWGNAFGKNKRFGFAADLGVMYQGSPEVDLKVDGIIADNPQFQNDLQAEIDDINDDIKDYKYYPVVSIGVSYNF